MSDASSVPLEAESGAGGVSTSWKGRATGIAGVLGGAIVSLLCMGARPNVPGGLLLGTLGTGVSVASLLGLLGDARPAEREVSLARVAAPLASCLASLVWLWLLLSLAVAGVLPAQTLL